MTKKIQLWIKAGVISVALAMVPGLLGIAAASPANAAETETATKIRSITGDFAKVFGPKSSLTDYIANIIQVVLSVLGVVFLVLVIYAGYQWLISRGEKSKVQAAQNILKEAVIGLAIVLAANIITYFVISRLQAGVGIPANR